MIYILKDMNNKDIEFSKLFRQRNYLCMYFIAFSAEILITEMHTDLCIICCNLNRVT